MKPARGAAAPDERMVGELVAETGLTRAEAESYLVILRKGSVAKASGGKDIARLLAAGMVIISGDGRRVIPVHPRLAVANSYRTWREKVVREVNERRMRVDRLIFELIPIYDAATEKRAGE